MKTLSPSVSSLPPPTSNNNSENYLQNSMPISIAKSNLPNKNLTDGRYSSGFYSKYCLIGTLLFFILLNIFLITWIVVSLNLHQNSAFIRRKAIDIDSNDYRLRILGNLSSNNTLYTNLIEEQLPLLSSSLSPISAIHYSDVDLFYKNLLKILTSNDKNSSFDCYLEIESYALNFEDSELRNSIKLLLNGNIEMKINKKLLIEQEKPNRMFQLEQNRLIIEDSSTLPHIEQQNGGIRISQLITDSIIGCVDQDLRLESRNEQLKINAQVVTNIESNNGEINLNAHNNIWLKGNQHIRMNSENIYFANLNSHFDNEKLLNQNFTNFMQTTPNHKHKYKNNIRRQFDSVNLVNDKPLAYQVCICANGMLFAVEENMLCQADQTICATMNYINY